MSNSTGFILLGHRVGPLLRKTGKEILDDGVLGLAAQTAYYFFFSLFPLLLFSAPILSLLGDRQQVFGTLFGQLANALPPEAWKLVEGVLKDVVFSSAAPGLMSIGALLAAWAGSNIFSALMGALNRAYDVSETRAWWKRQLLALAAVPVAGVILTTATLVVLAGDHIARWLGNAGGVDAGSRSMWMVAQFPLAFLLLMGLAWLLFWFLPDVRQDWRHTLTAAVVTTLLWIIVTLVFRAYVQNIANYNTTYGAIGGVIVLLTWMYLSRIGMLVGGERAAELHHGTGAVHPRRGATLAGRITTGHAVASTDRIGEAPASVTLDAR